MGRRVYRDPGKLKGKSAPVPLDLVRNFVNTKYGSRHSELTTAGQLRTWLLRHGLLNQRAAVTEGDLRRSLGVREAIRALLRANTSGQPEAGCITALNNVARNAPLRAFFDRSGNARLIPDIGGVDGALGLILSVVVMATVNGTWGRLKACRNGPCQFAFFDRSRNRSAVWCSMSICGNRLNSRLYRRRHGKAARRRKRVV